MSDGGKGSAQRPTDLKKFQSNYNQIKWERNESDKPVQDSPSPERPVAEDGKSETR